MTLADGQPQIVKDPAAKRLVVSELLAEVKGSLVDLTSRRDLLGRQLAACGLARVTQLLDGMFVLFEHGLEDPLSVLLRPAYEAWLISLYCIYGGDEAFQHVRGAYVREVDNLPEDLQIGRSLSARWEGPRDKIMWEDLARTIGDLLVAQGDPLGPKLIGMYQSVYRGESMTTSHAGVGSLAGYIDDTDSRLSVRIPRHSADDGSGRILMAGAILQHLAGHVLDAFDLDSRHLDTYSSRLWRPDDAVP